MVVCFEGKRKEIKKKREPMYFCIASFVIRWHHADHFQRLACLDGKKSRGIHRLPTKVEKMERRQKPFQNNNKKLLFCHAWLDACLAEQIQYILMCVLSREE